MPLTLARPEDAAKLSGLKWVCCECLSVNRPTQVICVVCGKQRFVQLGLSEVAAQEVADRVNEVGQ